jgi:transposase
MAAGTDGAVVRPGDGRGQIAKVAFTSEDRVRAVLHNFDDDGFESLYRKYSRGRPPSSTLPQRREIKKIALARPEGHDLPFSTWSLAKLADFLVAEGVVDDISHEGLRALLREEGVSFQAIKTFKVSNDPDFEAKKDRVLELYDIADGKAKPKRGGPTVVFCVDEFGPLNLQPHPGKQWAPVAAGRAIPARRVGGAGGRRSPDPTVSATCSPPTTWAGTGSMGTSSPARAASSSWRSAAISGRCISPRCGSPSCSTKVVRSCDSMPGMTGICWPSSSCPPTTRTGWRVSPHLSTKKDQRVGDWAAANNVELAYVPFYASWLNRIEAQFTALRYFTLNGTDHESHHAQARMIRRYIAWRNRHADDTALRELVKRANVA